MMVMIGKRTSMMVNDGSIIQSTTRIFKDNPDDDDVQQSDGNDDNNDGVNMRELGHIASQHINVFRSLFAQLLQNDHKARAYYMHTMVHRADG